MYEKPNCAYLKMQVFRFSQAIIHFRIGIRRINAELVRSAKFHIKELFTVFFIPVIKILNYLMQFSINLCQQMYVKF